MGKPSAATGRDRPPVLRSDVAVTLHRGVLTVRPGLVGDAARIRA